MYKKIGKLCLISCLLFLFSCSEGTKTNISFSVSVNNWNFKDVLIALTSEVDIIVTSQGTKDFKIHEIKMHGINSDSFNVIQPTSLPTPQNPIIILSKATLLIKIRFSSVAPAGIKTASLTLEHNAKGSPRTILLRGNSFINPVGDYLWAQAWGGIDNEEVLGIAADSHGNIFVVGQFEGVADFNPYDDGDPNTTDDVDEHISNGLTDAFLSKFDKHGVWQWTKTWGGPGVDRATGVVVDSNDFIYVVGDFVQTVDFNPSNNYDIHSSLRNSRDCFITKYDSTGRYYWTKIWGGNQDEWVYTAAIDANNNIAVVGKYRASTTFGFETYISNGQGDCFVSVFNTSGAFIWTRTWGGDDPDHATAVAFDANGNVYVAGFFQKTVQFGQGGNTVTKRARGELDCYLVKYNSNGVFQWVNTWGGIDNERPRGVATDSQGNVYVVGEFRGTANFDSSGGTDNRTSAGNSDCFLVKFDSSGNYMFTHTWGGTGSDTASGVSVCKLDNVFVCGDFRGIVDFNPHNTGVDVFRSDGVDCFFMKFDNIGNYLWTRVFGEDDNDKALVITHSKQNHILVGGFHRGVTDFNPFDDGDPNTTFDVDERTSYGWNDAFLSKFE